MAKNYVKFVQSIFLPLLIRNSPVEISSNATPIKLPSLDNEAK